MIVVIDCNIWISLAINGEMDFIADLSDNGIIIASCQTLKAELNDVLNRPKLSRFVSEVTIKNVMALHDLVTRKFVLKTIIPVVSDPKDNYLFALAVKSKADYLITGDKLLIKEKDYQNTKVITLTEFKTLYK
jgi:putative PIN family toxin of toxin-antitoxin system